MKRVTEEFMDFDTGKLDPIYRLYPFLDEDATDREIAGASEIIIRKVDGVPKVTINSTLTNMSFINSIKLAGALDEANKLCWQFDVPPYAEGDY